MRKVTAGGWRQGATVVEMLWAEGSRRRREAPNYSSYTGSPERQSTSPQAARRRRERLSRPGRRGVGSEGRNRRPMGAVTDENYVRVGDRRSQGLKNAVMNLGGRND